MALRVLLIAHHHVNETNFPLQFHQGDLELRSVEAVSAQLRVSRAFVRLCVAGGCPTQGGKLSSAELLTWLFEHSNLARQICGFVALGEVEGLEPEAAKRLKMGNALLTILEFGETRATRPEEKAALHKVRRAVERALDRA